MISEVQSLSDSKEPEKISASVTDKFGEIYHDNSSEQTQETVIPSYNDKQIRLLNKQFYRDYSGCDDSSGGLVDDSTSERLHV